MKVRKCFGLVATTIVLSFGILSFGAAGAAHAADYPPTTSNEVVQGTTVPTTMVSPISVSPVSTSGLPFTGGNDGALVWVGIAAVATGTFTAARFRRRTRVS
jgi:hypothetical protein